MSKNKQDKIYISFKNQDLCEILFKSRLKCVGKTFIDLEQHISNQTNCPDSKKGDLKIALRNFKKSFISNWDRCGRHKDRFYESEKMWLECVSKFELYQTHKGGRPAKNFDECSEQSKRRKTAEIRHAYSSDELTYAAQMSLRACGKRNEAKTVLKIVNPCTSEHKTSDVCRMLTNEQALSLMMEAQLSRRQYNIIRNYAKDIFPSYKNVRTAKKQCLPEGITVTDVESNVPLQSLLDHTAHRIMRVQKDALTGTLTGTSRKANLEDVFHRLLVSSDPFITSLRPLVTNKGRSFDPKVRDMLLAEDMAHMSTESDASEDEE